MNIARKKRIPDTRVHCCLYFISPTGHSYVPAPPPPPALVRVFRAPRPLVDDQYLDSAGESHVGPTLGIPRPSPRTSDFLAGRVTLTGIRPPAACWCSGTVARLPAGRGWPARADGSAFVQSLPALHEAGVAAASRVRWGGTGLLDRGWWFGRDAGFSCRYVERGQPSTRYLEMKAGSKRGMLGALLGNSRWGWKTGLASRGWRGPSGQAGSLPVGGGGLVTNDGVRLQGQSSGPKRMAPARHAHILGNQGLSRCSVAGLRNSMERVTVSLQNLDPSRARQQIASLNESPGVRTRTRFGPQAWGQLGPQMARDKAPSWTPAGLTGSWHEACLEALSHRQ